MRNKMIILVAVLMAFIGGTGVISAEEFVIDNSLQPMIFDNTACRNQTKHTRGWQILVCHKNRK